MNRSIMLAVMTILLQLVTAAPVIEPPVQENVTNTTESNNSTNSFLQLEGNKTIPEVVNPSPLDPVYCSVERREIFLKWLRKNRDDSHSYNTMWEVLVVVSVFGASIFYDIDHVLSYVTLMFPMILAILWCRSFMDLKDSILVVQKAVFLCDWLIAVGAITNETKVILPLSNW
jgi:hypothetical protein